MTDSLVDYASSSDSEAVVSTSRTKRKLVKDPSSAEESSSAIPALPNSFFSLYATNARGSTVDDPTLHGGRKRQVAHKEGNWPTHVYLEWYPDEQEEAYLKNAIDDAQNQLKALYPTDEVRVHPLLRSDLGVQLPLHVSLSAPLVLQTENKDSFRDAIQNEIPDCGAICFAPSADKIEWVSNDDRTRWFLVLKLGDIDMSCFESLLAACNRVAQRFGLAQLYADRGAPGECVDDTDVLFHISFGWTLHDPKKGTAGNKKSNDENNDGNEVDGGGGGDLYDTQKTLWQSIHTLDFHTVKLKIGNVVHDIPIREEDQSEIAEAVRMGYAQIVER